MPKKRFENLPSGKKERIRQEILKQLSENTLDDFSVKKLMSDLKLDRRSFSFYFNGLDDMVGFVLKDYWDKEMEYYNDLFVQEKGIKVTNISKIILMLVSYAEKQNYLVVLKNIYLSMKLSIKNSFEIMAKDTEDIFSDLMPQIIKQITGADKKIKDDEQLKKYFLYLISMCILLYRSTLVAIFCDVSNKEKIMNSLDFKLDIIQKGVKEKLKEIIDDKIEH